MVIRRAKAEDMDCILEAYSAARLFMRATGNKNQWADNYPSPDLIAKGIRDGKQYVCVSGDRVAGTFYFAVEPDETYTDIYEGRWLNDKPYGVVHRLASDGRCKGVGQFCLQWCFEQCGNLKIDTHEENTVMRHILRKSGFLPCGIIFLRSGAKRLAFQKE